MSRKAELAQQYEEITVRRQEGRKMMCQYGVLCAWWNKAAHLASGMRKGKTFTPPRTGSRCDATNALSRQCGSDAVSIYRFDRCVSSNQLSGNSGQLPWQPRLAKCL